MSDRTYLSAEELQYFKKKLEQELQEIIKRNEDALKEMEHTTIIDEFHGDEADLAIVLEERNRYLKFRDRDRKLIERIKISLKKIEDGTYGICENCGEPISKERLELRPLATLCIACKREQEEREKLEKSIKRRRG